MHSSYSVIRHRGLSLTRILTIQSMSTTCPIELLAMVCLPNLSPNIVSRVVIHMAKNWTLPGRVPGLPIRDCARGCNNRAQMCAQLSAIDVTARTFFERLYLVLGLCKIAPWVKFSYASTILILSMKRKVVCSTRSLTNKLDVYTNMWPNLMYTRICSTWIFWKQSYSQNSRNIITYMFEINSRFRMSWDSNPDPQEQHHIPTKSAHRATSLLHNTNSVICRLYLHVTLVNFTTVQSMRLNQHDRIRLCSQKSATWKLLRLRSKNTSWCRTGKWHCLKTRDFKTRTCFFRHPRESPQSPQERCATVLKSCAQGQEIIFACEFAISSGYQIVTET